MQYLYYLIIIVISSLIYIPIEKKYKFNERYQNKENRKLRFSVILIGGIGIICELLIGFSNLEYGSLMRNLLEFIFSIPIIILLFVGNPFINHEK